MTDVHDRHAGGQSESTVTVRGQSISRFPFSLFPADDDALADLGLLKRGQIRGPGTNTIEAA